MMNGIAQFDNKNTSFLCAICCLLSVVFSCGYAVYSRASLPFREVMIVSVENKTDEPKLQDRLSRALSDELLGQGIAVNTRAAYSLRGKITLFELRILAESENVATEYEIIIKGDFSLTDPAGNVREFKDVGSPFFVSFSGTGELNSLLAHKELAAEKAIRDMAEKIVAALIYR